MGVREQRVEELGEVLQQEKISTLWLTAGLFHEVVNNGIERLRGVKQLLAGGDVLRVGEVGAVLEQLPECRLINGYGPTEGTTFSCCHRVSAEDCVGNSVPIGKPIANTQVYVLDGSREPVPMGVSGEIYIGGSGSGAGVSESSGADGGAVRGRSVQPGRGSADVPDGRSGAVAGGRDDWSFWGATTIR